MTAADELERMADALDTAAKERADSAAGLRNNLAAVRILAESRGLAEAALRIRERIDELRRASQRPDFGCSDDCRLAHGSLVPGAPWSHGGKTYRLASTSSAFGSAWAHFEGLYPAVELSELTHENGWRYMGPRGVCDDQG